MTGWKWMGILSLTLCSAGWIVPGNLYAGTDGFTLEDLKLRSAGDLLDVCALEQEDENYTAARAFCYGFFEGAIRYAEAISGSEHHRKLVCVPPGITRLQAVEVFVAYMGSNPQYAEESPVNAIYRALIPLWPCAE
jgi:hypothetical protein